MPFYQTDNITCCVFTAITEDIENCLESDKKDRVSFERLTDILAHYNTSELKALCKSYIEMSCAEGYDSPFFTAVLNSINLENLHRYLVEWAEDVKNDIDADSSDEKFD